MQQSVRRLTEGFRPSHYDLHITQDSENLSFSGSVTITGIRGIGPLALHTADLVITHASVNNTPVNFSISDALKEVELSDTHAEGTELSLELSFTGTITRPMHGLYPCYFDNGDGKECILATQFESHHAREVFPCIDEPEAKATFQLHLTVPNQDIAISNTPLLSTEQIPDSQLVTHHFETTPVMSTYLLAWASGNFVYEETTSTHGVLVRAYTTPIHAGKTSYALDIAARTLDYLDDYFDIPYPLKKYDIVALPDFAAGAMENWGMVTYREGSMLIDEHSDMSDKQHVANTTIHEISHQWFGNLVTMRWWNDLWLNEGFASWIPYMVMDDMFPEWNIWEQFTGEDLSIGLHADALQHSHPIVVEINSPEEIRSAFDSISYDKGCSVIHLIYRFIGKDAFRSGLQAYLKAHAYGSAETKDLWAAWSVAADKDVLAFAKTWTEQAGFPLLTVESDTSSMQITQKRFFLDPSHEPDDTCWPVPLMRSNGDTELLEQKSATFDTPAKLNDGQSGFYRTIYRGDIKTTLQQDLAANKLSPLNTLGLITDASEAAKAGYHATTEALELIRSIPAATTSEPLISGVLGEIAEYRTVFTESYEGFKPFVGRLIKPHLERLGIDLLPSDSIDDQLLRPAILSASSYAGNTSVIEWALSSFHDAASPDDLRADTRSLIYQAAIKYDQSIETYEKLLRWHNTTTIPGEQMPLAAALCNVDSEPLLSRSLDLVSINEVRLQDARFWIAFALLNRTQKQIAWEWVQRNWQWIGDNYGQEKELDYFLRYCASGFANDTHLRSYTAFFESVDIYGSERAFEQGKETIRWQSAWAKRDHQKIAEWLKKFSM